jgi:hypothetical protein
MIPYYRIFLVAMFGLSSVLSAASTSAFTFSKDSVVETELSGKSDTVVMTNMLSDTLRIDSIAILFDTTQMPFCEIDFTALPAAPVRSLVIQLWSQYSWGNQSSHLALNPKESVKLVNFQFDLCIHCPVVNKRLNKGLNQVGDTIRAAIVFIAGNFKDTVKIIGKRTSLFSEVRSNPPSEISVRQKTSTSLFNPMGRRISLNSHTGCVIDMNSKRMLLPEYGPSGDR